MTHESSPWAVRRHRRGRGSRPNARQSEGSFGRLISTRTWVRWGLVVLMVVTLAVAWSDLSSREGRPDALDLVIGLTYGAIGSILATILVTLVQIQFQIRERLEKATEALKVLGVTPSLGTRVALVLIARDGINMTRTYARRDILLVADLIRLMQRAGLDAPLILSDQDFMLQAEAPHSAWGLLTNVEDGQRLITTNVICIGLWSNALLEKLADASPDMLPVQLERDAQRVVLPSGRVLKLKDDYAFVARFHLRDVVLTVLAGTYSLPTARLGDFLSSMPDVGRSLWEVDSQHDFWATIRCPGEGEDQRGRRDSYVVEPPMTWNRARAHRTLHDWLTPSKGAE